MLSGRVQIIPLLSRFSRILESEAQVAGQPPWRGTHTYTAAACQRISNVQQPLATCHGDFAVFTPVLCRSAVTKATQESGRFKQLIKKIGWLDYSRNKLRRSGYILYSKACDASLMSDFSEVCELPDTFYSWFLVTELHVWLIAVRVMAEGEEGRYSRNAMVEALWQDCDTRAKKLGAGSLSILKEQMESLGSSFQATLFAYDEGLMSDDRVLASALWRRLFSQECSDPERLECVVNYVRRQMAVLDNLSRDEILMDCKVKWVPLLEPEATRSF